jgi:hypothetical protein
MFFKSMKVFLYFCDHLLECEFLSFDIFEIKTSNLVFKHRFIAIVIIGLGEFHNKAVANEDFQLCIQYVIQFATELVLLPEVNLSEILEFL